MDKSIDTVSFSIREVASQLRCSRQTVAREIDAGRLRAFHIGGLVRIERSELHSYIDRCGYNTLEHRLNARSPEDRAELKKFLQYAEQIMEQVQTPQGFRGAIALQIAERFATPTKSAPTPTRDTLPRLIDDKTHEYQQVLYGLDDLAVPDTLKNYGKAPAGEAKDDADFEVPDILKSYGKNKQKGV